MNGTRAPQQDWLGVPEHFIVREGHQAMPHAPFSPWNVGQETKPLHQEDQIAVFAKQRGGYEKSRTYPTM